MAVLFITEHPYPTIHSGNLQTVAQMPPIASQTVAIAAGSAQSAAFSNTTTQKTRVVCLHTDAICSVKFGSNPTATATDRRLAANSTEYFEVTPGDKVAVIVNV